MLFKKFFGFEAKLDNVLSDARGDNDIHPHESDIRKLERKLETAKLTPAEISKLQSEIRKLKSYKY